jgi:hypothetical protein
MTSLSIDFLLVSSALGDLDVFRSNFHGDPYFLINSGPCHDLLLKARFGRVSTSQDYTRDPVFAR